MNYETWLETVPEEITNDALWTVEAYRLALYSADLGWQDTTKLIRDARTKGLSAQLYSALGSIGANVSEGYSRSSGKDRARFYEYALGSARESRNWYYDARCVLSEEVTRHRSRLLTQIIRLLLTMIPDQRRAEPFHDKTVIYKRPRESCIPGPPLEILDHGSPITRHGTRIADHLDSP